MDLDEVWVINNAFVTEAFLGGRLLGELPDFDLSGKAVSHYSQAEFDQMMAEFQDDNGYYPDT